MRFIGFMLLAPLTLVANMIPCGGFEAWDDATGLPTNAKWRWGFQKGKEKGFAAFERTATERFSGGYSLHIKDDDSGTCNNTVSYSLSGNERKKVAGQRLWFAGRVKQVFASSSDVVGLAINVQDGDGRWIGASIGTGTRGAMDWRLLRVSLHIPPNAKSVQLVLNCAHGFGNRGEAFFDDLVASTDLNDIPKVDLSSPDVLGHADWALPPVTNDTPEAAAYRDSYRTQKPQEEDNRVRPEIRNGTWYVNGSPEYYLGVWLYNRTDSDWGKNPDVLGTGHPAYIQPPNKKLFAQLGFNSSQISAAQATPGAAIRGLPLPYKDKPWRKDWRDNEKLASEFYPRFGDMPLVLDFAFGYNKSYPKDGENLLNQYNQHWHAFVPFCPEHPEGDRYYRDYFLGGVRTAMRYGCNVFLYELFNESSYNCQCPWNIRAFVERMKERYRTIATANAVWGTDFVGFDDVASQSGFKRFPGVWRDWCEFSSDRYAAILRKYQGVIRSADHRSRVYFTEQASGTPSQKPGMDYRKIADALDVLAIEGGWRYGSNSVFLARNEMEDVVATSGSKHFFNCDFYQALAKGCKPIVNNEHYCTRLEGGIRVPSRREDFITSLWLEVMHGVSANFTYVWDKRQWDWRTFEEAKRNVIQPSYKSSSLLNPYNMPPENLDCFAIFQKELAPYKDKLLPFPRVKPATVAVYYSQASMVQRDNLPRLPGEGPAWSNARDSAVARWYTALLHFHFPVKVVFDEDLNSLGPEVKAVVFPGSQCVSDETLAAVRACMERGLHVIADETAFKYDEYMKPRTALEVPRAVNGSAAAKMLLARGVPRHAVLEPADGSAKLFMASDVQVCDRGEFKLVCLANLGDCATHRARLRLNLPGDTGDYYLFDVVKQQMIPNGDKRKWNAIELARGVEFDLPGQERMVFTLTTTEPKVGK